MSYACYIPLMQAPHGQSVPRPNRFDARLLVVVGVALIVCFLVSTHISDINGPWYWKWTWRTIPLRRYWVMFLPAIPFAAAQMLSKRKWIAVGLLVLCALQMRLSWALVEDARWRLDWLAGTVRNPLVISYYSDASAIGQDPDWLARYPQILPLTNLHTCSKPPGPVAYYMMWIRLLGYGSRSARVAGLGIISLTSLVVPLVYLLARRLTGDANAGFAAASFIALCPGAVFTVPMLDPVYAGWTCLILLSWDRSLRSGSFAWATACGLTCAAGVFCSYSLLTLATFAAIQALLVWRPARPLRTLPLLLIGVLAGFAIFYGVLWMCTYFDPIATFRSAWHNQQVLLFRNRDQRPYPQTILYDLTDFALGMGWVGVVIALMGVLRALRDRSLRSGFGWLLVACMVQPIFIAVTGQLQSETLRVWNFMLPLVSIAAGFELARWTPRGRALALGAMFVVMLTMGRNMHML
jgi:4-amino-4-deoxy-L-arabinose transferase-like glycosyltransferase